MIARCPACGQLFPVAGNARMACPFCAAPLDITIERPFYAPPTRTSTQPLPWDDTAAGPRPRRFFATLRLLLFSPRAAFERAAAVESSSPAPAIAFAVWAIFPALFVQTVGLALLARTHGGAQVLDDLFDDPTAVPALLGELPWLPVAALMAALFLGSTYQLATTLVTGRRPPVASTVRAVCFGFAPAIFAAVPIFGLLVAIPWSLALHAVGLRHVSGLGRIQAVLVVLAPLLVIAASFVYG